MLRKTTRLINKKIEENNEACGICVRERRSWNHKYYMDDMVVQWNCCIRTQWGGSGILSDSCTDVGLRLRTQRKGGGCLALKCPHSVPGPKMKSCCERTTDRSVQHLTLRNHSLLEIKAVTFQNQSHTRPCPLIYWGNHSWNAVWLQLQCIWSCLGHKLQSLRQWDWTEEIDGVDCLITTMAFEQH